MKITYKQKLTLSFILIFTLFTAGVIVFEQYGARRYKTEALEERLDAYCDIVYAYISERGAAVTGTEMDSLLAILPANLRLTYIAADGKVLYDNLFPDPGQLENHSGRPEIAAAASAGQGYDIRESASNSQPYLYYAKYYGNAVMRAALPYDIQVQHFLKPDNAFLYFIVVLFIIGLLLIRYVGGRFGNSIQKLRDFSAALELEGGENIAVPLFPNDELGEIGKSIAGNYKRLKDSESKFARERERLLQHIYISAEGICFFAHDGKVAFYNGLFLQYLNAISPDPDLNNILSVDAFAPVKDFIAGGAGDNYYEYTIRERDREFLLRLNRFDDNSFEIVLNDVSEQEKTRRLKREMTGNIAHELRTPVTSIRGYLETVLETPLNAEQQRKFTEKAYNQTLVLSELIRDMGLLTKIEETPDKFDFKSVDLHDVVEKVRTDLKDDIAANGVTFRNDLPVGTTVSGNESLLYSIFRNLADNAVKHAGRDIDVVVGKIADGGKTVAVSFADTGRGIADEKGLSRIFERFYRIDEGRTRENGGSGLGLSIVKNAVLIHGGDITARNRDGGGLEFIIHLPV